ncbi:hypothetical protein GPECTOR_67g327 [Gonium pectorale]|uniref:WW domain-containing protein n=1 Tax=Gonium pectorale TaxID=33097 RepID=A0A150G3N1_GONPE|nr:hypothetical protein GPECTOR_67g327 [Gonium pectorale]|eukprot:KXZ44486.1 hypothetical protein GPECTOR_67g327 [Gonium pectorale]
MASKPTTDRLVAALKQKNLSSLMDELSVKGLDVNAPDSSRRLPLAEAVRTRDIRAVQALLDQGALAKSHEPGTSITPLHIALQGNMVAIARTLMAHGADPNACCDSANDDALYINSVTGQEVTSVPPALAWAKVRAADGTELWLNWAARVSSSSVPAELPIDMAAELGRTVNARWYNPASGEFSYTDPAYTTAWRELKDEATEQPFFYNVETGETVWEVPEEMAWTRVNDPDGGAAYFFNRRSGEVSWNPPSSGPLSFIRAGSDL